MSVCRVMSSKACRVPLSAVSRGARDFSHSLAFSLVTSQRDVAFGKLFCEADGYTQSCPAASGFSRTSKTWTQSTMLIDYTASSARAEVDENQRGSW